MALYKSPVAGTKKVRLGASTCVSALPSELVGILLENAAMLGPDYIVDRQEVRKWGRRMIVSRFRKKTQESSLQGLKPFNTSPSDG